MKNVVYADGRGWESWQQEYRWGALYIFPPSGIIEAVDALRQRYDPKSAAICQAHISLSAPLSAPLTEFQHDEFAYVLASVAPFDLHYGPLRSFPPYPGVTYAIQPEAPFMVLRQILHTTSSFAQGALTREHIPPHMTIAEFITLEQTHALLTELDGHVPEGSFHCAAVEYAVPNEDFYFERVLRFPLTG